MEADATLGWLLTLAPGLAQGLTSVSLGHPLDTAKTRMQARGPQGGRSAFATMWKMVQHEGPRSLYRGVTPPLVMVGTKRSLQFALWDVFRGRSRLKPRSTPEAVPAEDRDTATRIRAECYDRLVRLTTWVGSNPFRSGCVAGGLGTVIGCPMHITKIKTQYSTRGEMQNAMTCAIAIARNEGFFGFYRGFRYQLLKDVCFAGLYLGLYDVNKAFLRSRYGDFSNATAATAHVAPPASGSTADGMGGPASPTRRRGARFDGLYGLSTNKLAFIAGSGASMTTWLVLYPLDTIKTIVQARNVGLSGVVRLVREEKVGLLYRGLPAALVKAGPVSGIAMIAYERVKQCTEAYADRHTGAHLC